MIPVEQILSKIGITLENELVKAIQDKQLRRVGASGSFSSVANASGELARSVRHDVKGSVLTIYADDYIYYLEKGRKPGKKPPLQVIRQWIDDKGITPTDISKDSLAFLIQRRIGEEGTTIYQAGGSDLVSGIFNEQLIDSIEREFAELVLAEINSDILSIAA